MKLGRVSIRRAFTLVELLVVIGIIAIMISILLPALNKVRDKARAVQCASNMRQIYVACQMFAQDNGGHLPSPGFAGDMIGNGDGSRDPQGAVEVARDKNVVWCQRGDGLADFKFGALWRYIQGEPTRRNIIFCPGDNGEQVRYGSIRRVGGEGRDFSYSFHAQTMDRNDMRAAYFPGAAPKNQILPGIRLGSVRAAAARIYIAEEIGPNDTFWLNPLTDTFHGISQNDDDTPSGRHAGQKFLNALRNTNTSSREYKAWKTAGKGNHCFFDGHVEPLSPGDILDDKRQENYYLPLF